MEIVTGSTGLAHVTPIDDAVRNTAAGFYSDRVVFNTFRAFEAVAVTANEVRVYGGYGMNQGRIFKIDRLNYDSCTIENGAQGVKRSDLIVARYTMNGQTGFEDISLVVIKGQAGNEYVDPSYTTGNMNEGDMQDDFPLYRVKLNGIVIEAVERLFTPLPDGGRFGQLEDRVKSHLNNTNNPHTIAWQEAEALAPISAGETLKVQFGKIAKAIKSLISHIGNFSNPHKVGGSQLTDIVPISKGGTGASNAAGALENLGIPSVTPIDKGGTGATTAAAAREKLGVIPTNHASSATTYGVGNASNFGHVKLTDSYDVSSPSAASDGVAASQKAVKNAYDAVLAAMGSAGYGDMMKNVYDPDNKGLDNTAGGTANRKSPVSSGALYATKAALQSSFQDGVDTIYNATKNAGVTPSSSTPTAIATAIGNVYSKGKTDASNGMSFTVSRKTLGKSSSLTIDSSISNYRMIIGYFACFYDTASDYSSTPPSLDMSKVSITSSGTATATVVDVKRLDENLYRNASNKYKMRSTIGVFFYVPKSNLVSGKTVKFTVTMSDSNYNNGSSTSNGDTFFVNF
jgi:hypothetical protein